MSWLSRGWLLPFFNFLFVPMAQEDARVSFENKMSMAAFRYPDQHLYAEQYALWWWYQNTLEPCISSVICQNTRNNNTVQALTGTVCEMYYGKLFTFCLLYWLYTIKLIKGHYSTVHQYLVLFGWNIIIIWTLPLWVNNRFVRAIPVYKIIYIQLLGGTNYVRKCFASMLLIL